MIAPLHTKNSAGIGVGALFGLFDPRPVHPDGNIVFGFAGDRTSVTADAFPIVYDKSVLHVRRKL